MAKYNVSMSVNQSMQNAKMVRLQTMVVIRTLIRGDNYD